jgi:hypothetical protein
MWSSSLPVCLSIYLSIYLSICLSVYPSVSICLSVVYLFVYLSVCLSIYLSIYLSICLCVSVCLSVCLSVYLSIYISICLSISLSSMPWVGFELTIQTFQRAKVVYTLDCAAAVIDFISAIFFTNYHLISNGLHPTGTCFHGDVSRSLHQICQHCAISVWVNLD